MTRQTRPGRVGTIALIATGLALSAWAAGIELEPIPVPNLDEVEPAIVEQLREQRTLADSLASAADVDTIRLSEAMGKLGQLYILYELLGPAEPALANASMLAPDDFRWPYLEATIAQEQRRLPDARRLLEKALELEPDYLPALIRLGDVERAAGDDPKARTYYDRALEIAPGSPAANWGLGQIAYGAGESERAVEHFEAVLEVQPHATAVHYPLGLAYRDLDQMDKAREHLTQRGERGIQPADPLVDGLANLVRGSSLYMVRGNRAFARGAYGVAVSAYTGAVEADPENVVAREALASALSRMGRRRDSLEQIGWVIDNGHASAGTYYNYGAIHAELGEVDEALSGYETALRMDPDLIDANFNLALLLGELGRLSESEAYFDRVLELDPQDTAARVHRASVIADLGRSAEAAAELGAVLSVDPANSQALLALGAVEAATGRPADALGRYATIIASSDSSTAESREAVARAHFESGRLMMQGSELQDALEHLRTAVEMMPRIAEARMTLARLLGATGRYGEAAEQYGILLTRNSRLLEAHFGLALSLLLERRDTDALAALERATEAFPEEAQLEHLLARVLAASSDDSVRDGERAVSIAERLFAAQQSIASAETLAMALAEAGRFDDAATLQERIRAEAERSGGVDLAPIDRRIEQYRRGEPVRTPWLGNG